MLPLFKKCFIISKEPLLQWIKGNRSYNEMHAAFLAAGVFSFAFV